MAVRTKMNPVARAQNAAAASDLFAADEGQVRLELVSRVRRQIELENYETDARLDAALDRLIIELQAA